MKPADNHEKCRRSVDVLVARATPHLARRGNSQSGQRRRRDCYGRVPVTLRGYLSAQRLARPDFQSIDKGLTKPMKAIVIVETITAITSVEIAVGLG